MLVHCGELTLPPRLQQSVELKAHQARGLGSEGALTRQAFVRTCPCPCPCPCTVNHLHRCKRTVLYRSIHTLVLAILCSSALFALFSPGKPNSSPNRAWVMTKSSIYGASLSRAGLCHYLKSSSRPAVCNISTFLLQEQRTGLTASKRAPLVDLQYQYQCIRNSKSFVHHKQPVSLPSIKILILIGTRLTFEQAIPLSTHIRPRRAATFQQASKLSCGVRGVARTKRNHLLPLPSKPSNSFNGIQKLNMSTLSQPQTPAALNSPLREHRHRPVERLADHLETPSLDDRSYRVIRLVIRCLTHFDTFEGSKRNLC